MCKVVPGRANPIPIERCQPYLSPSRELGTGFDSHAAPNALEWFLFEPSQTVPTHILTIKAVPNPEAVSIPHSMFGGHPHHHHSSSLSSLHGMNGGSIGGGGHTHTHTHLNGSGSGTPGGGKKN